MKKTIVNYIIVCCLYTACTKDIFSTKAEEIKPTNPNIEYIGRWDKRDTNAYISHWGGAYFRLYFTGSSANIKLTAITSLKIYLDNQPGYLQNDKKEIVLGGLATGSHALTVAANFQSDEIGLYRVKLDDTARLLPLPPKKQLLEFVGNSVTSGSGEHNSQASFAWLLGEKMGYDHTQIAFGGITLVDGYNNHNNLPHGQATAYFELKEPSAPNNSRFNFNDYTPAMIVIELGTNDGASHVPIDKFEKTYINFIKNIRLKYPDTKIVLLSYTSCSNYGAAQTQHVVELYNNAGDKKIYFISTDKWLAVADDTVDGCHPNASGNKKLADSLQPRLTDILNR